MQLNEASNTFEEKTGDGFINITYSAPTETGDVEQTVVDLFGNGVNGNANLPPEAFAGVGRNDPCPCGSGKKYKQCHGKLN